LIDGYLRLMNADGQPIEGESTDHNFAKYIQIYEFGLCPSASDAEVALGDIADDARTTMLLDVYDKMKRWDEQKEKIQKRKEEQERLQRQAIAQRMQQRSLSGLDLVTRVVADKAADHVAKAQAETGDSRLSFKISKDVDSASADLFQGYCSTVFQPNPNKQYRKLGEFKKAEVSLRKMFDVATGTTVPLPYLVVTFTDVAIDSYALSYNSSRFHMTETIVFKFVAYRMQFTPQDRTGETANPGLIASGTLARKAAG
jgi:type VI protein secretion system component Hcp